MSTEINIQELITRSDHDTFNNHQEANASWIPDFTGIHCSAKQLMKFNLRKVINLPENIIVDCKKDFFKILDAFKVSANDVQTHQKTLTDGNLYGMQHSGTYCCVVGDMVRIVKKVETISSYEEVIRLSSERGYQTAKSTPIECLCLEVIPGHTTNNHNIVKIIYDFCEEYLELLKTKQQTA